LAESLLANQDAIIRANAFDIEAARREGLSEAMLDRLTITPAILARMAEGCRQIAALADPIGVISDIKPMPSGIRVGRMRVAIGVIGMIFESRPNVTIDAAALAIKSGNAIILRGGHEALQSNVVLADLVSEALERAGLPRDGVQLITRTDRALVGAMITAREWIDVLIPRGGKSLVSRLMKEATVPMIKHLDGICHTYVDADADLPMAVRIVENAKTQRYSPCKCHRNPARSQKDRL